MTQPAEYCFLLIDWWVTCHTKSDWAAWFQAIGAFLAIGAGAAGIYWQVHRQRRDDVHQRQQSQIRVLQHIGAAIFYCYYLLKAAIDESAKGGNLQARIADVERQVDLLARIDLLQIPDWRGTFAVDSVRGAFAELMTALHELQAESPPIGADPTKWRHMHREPHFNAAVDNFAVAIQTLQVALSERGVELQPMTLAFNGLAVSTDELRA